MLEVCKRLSIAISNSELSYAELEKKTGIAKSSIQRYATGTTKKIPIDAVKAIATATGRSAAWILGWEEEEEQYKKEDAITDIFKRLREDKTFLEASQILYELNEEQLQGVITLLSTFK